MESPTKKIAMFGSPVVDMDGWEDIWTDAWTDASTVELSDFTADWCKLRRSRDELAKTATVHSDFIDDICEPLISPEQLAKMAMDYAQTFGVSAESLKEETPKWTKITKDTKLFEGMKVKCITEIYSDLTAGKTYKVVMGSFTQHYYIETDPTTENTTHHFYLTDDDGIKVRAKNFVVVNEE